MKISIKNRLDAKLYIPEGTAAAIRVDDISPMKELKGNYENETQFFFSDINEETEYSITKEEAEEIKEFILKNKNVEEFLVHCHYGEGRSPAIAVFISELLDINTVNEKDYPNINTLVLEKLRKTMD